MFVGLLQLLMHQNKECIMYANYFHAHFNYDLLNGLGLLGHSIVIHNKYFMGFFKLFNFTWVIFKKSVQLNYQNKIR